MRSMTLEQDSDVTNKSSISCESDVITLNGSRAAIFLGLGYGNKVVLVLYLSDLPCL